MTRVESGAWRAGRPSFPRKLTRKLYAIRSDEDHRLTCFSERGLTDIAVPLQSQIMRARRRLSKCCSNAYHSRGRPCCLGHATARAGACNSQPRW